MSKITSDTLISEIMSDGELYHHGIMGMKWGVRRYQNKDGSLTEKGKARFKKVSENERLQKRDQKIATRITKKNLRIYRPERNAEFYNKKAEKARVKGNIEKAKQYIAKKKIFDGIGKALNTRLKDLQSGKLKAGRDFITQTDYDFWAFGPVMSLTTTRRVIEKPNKKKDPYDYTKSSIGNV